MFKPNFDMEVFKKTLVKESVKRKFSLDELDQIVKNITNNIYDELKHPSNGIIFSKTNSPKNLTLCFDSWYEQFQKRSKGLSGEYYCGGHEEFNEMFASNLLDTIYNALCYCIIEKHMRPNVFNNFENEGKSI
jgi:hypothetical protein